MKAAVQDIPGGIFIATFDMENCVLNFELTNLEVLEATQPSGEGLSSISAHLSMFKAKFLKL